MNVCARCKGRFPGPGIEKDEEIYCCDKCAKGPRRMIPKVIPAVLAIFGLGYLTGSLVQEVEHKNQHVVNERNKQARCNS